MRSFDSSKNKNNAHTFMHGTTNLYYSFCPIRDSIFQITIYIQKYNSKRKRKSLQKLGIYWLSTKYCDLQHFKLCFHTTAMMMIETAFFVAMNFFEKNFFSFSMQVSYFDIIGLAHKITWLNAFRNPFLIVHCYGS